MANGITDDKKWNVMLGAVTIGVLIAFVANQAAWFIIAIYIPANQEINPAILAILNQGSGSIGAFTAAVIGFWVGSSKGSQDKEDTAKQAAATVTKAVESAADATKATQATLDKMTTALTGTGNGANSSTINKPPVAPVVTAPSTVAVEGNLNLTPTTPTAEQLLDAAVKKFESGEYDEATFRAMLKSKEINGTDAEIEEAVEKYRPKKD